jgi:hypothetical protein
MKKKLLITDVGSTLIDKISYDSNSRVLALTFKTGRIYRYSEVPPGVVASLERAKSKGSFFANNIRGKYHTKRVR